MVSQKNNIRGIENPKGKEVQNHHLKEILSEYEDVFRDELPEGLPPQRSVDHEIKVENGVKPPHRPLFQLSPD